jgi:hypothetical protein
MKKKLLFALTAVLLAMLFIATPALAWCNAVTGEVHDSKTDTLWAYGGTVNVWDCAHFREAGTSLSGGAVAFSGGTFNIPVSAAPDDPPGYLCIDITFGSGSEGTPPDTVEIIQSTGATGGSCALPETIYTDTGPNAVTLADTTSTESPNVWLPVALAAVALVGAGGVVLLLRRRRVA